MVDVYRSKTCSMDDAEYVDTLKIENLKEHPNGEPSISFDIGLDENGELSTSIADPETGATSNSQITLVSRTIEERLQADDYSIAADDAVAADADEGSDNTAAIAAGAAVAGAGLLAAAAIASNNKDDAESAEPAADDDFSVIEEPAEDDFNLGDPSVTDEEVAMDDVVAADDAIVTDDTIASDDAVAADDPFAADDTIASDDAIAAGDDADMPPMDDFNFESDAPAETTEDMDLDEGIVDEPAAEDATFTEDATIAEDEPAAEDATIAEDAIITDDDFSTDDLPDFDKDMISDETFVSDEDTITDSEPDTFGEIPDFDDNAVAAEQNALLSDDFDDVSSDPEPEAAPAGGLSFTGLYDKETAMGNASENQDDDFKKKTRAPVIICIICAIICLVATALVLLVLPTKFNLRLKHKAKQETAVEKPVEEKKTEPVKEEKVPEAKEDKVVVIEKAEEVKPVPPPAAETKTSGVTYKIKWGDTLWDIADTYYKNPWRYKKIASYNNIKNPDHIISGTIITIPSE